MYRQYISKTSGHSFLRRFRNCLETLDEEIEKLETITADVKSISLAKSYFKEQTDFLSCINALQDDAKQLFEEVTTKLIDLDQTENQLLSIREKLIRFDEDPNKLKLGYKPFIPKDSEDFDDDEDDDDYNDDDETCSMASTNDDNNQQIMNDIDYSDQQKEETIVENFKTQLIFDNTDSIITPKSCSKTNKNLGLNDPNESFNILSTVKKNAKENGKLEQQQKRSNKKKKIKMDPTKVSDPTTAKIFAICNRWVKDEVDSSMDKSTSQVNNDDNVNGNSNNKKENSSNLMIKSSNHSNQDDFIPSKKIQTPKGTSAKKTNTYTRIKKIVQQEEYETVEFTPGMTTKVRKSGDGKQNY